MKYQLRKVGGEWRVTLPRFCSPTDFASWERALAYILWDVKQAAASPYKSFKSLNLL